VIAIDPGNRTGWAYFHANKLRACGWIRPNRWVDLVERALSREHIVIEEPTLYPHSKARPASVMALQLKVGELKGRFEANGCTVELVQPRTWKGQVPKAIHNRRALAALTPDEFALADGQPHDVIDAIGLGLWKLGRIK